MDSETQNPLISAQKSSDSGLQVALHPLVLLTISDYITRHTLRNQKGPVVGALLGQQNGREITIEHAFECLLVWSPNNLGEVSLNIEWFENRLQQMKDVHKVPALELVGWYTMMPTSGPQPVHLPLHQQILESYNESAILLGFHTSAVIEGSDGGKLPLTIYESNYEAEGSAAETGEDKEMEDGEAKLHLKFKELPYTVETGEAEMISVDFVARGGGNATAIDTGAKKPAEESAKSAKSKAKAPRKSDDTEPDLSNQALSREDEELIASLTAKANAIKMLHSRINLIAAYLQNLPPSYISGAPEGHEDDSKKYTPVNYSVLRSIQALLGRLSLLIPADAVAFEKEMISEQNDVSLITLLSTLTESIKDVRETGRKYSIIEAGRQQSKNKSGGVSGWDSNLGINPSLLGAGDLIA